MIRSKVYILIIIIIMESNILNPTYKELIAIEMYRNNDTGINYHNKHRNNWKKGLISIFAIIILLATMGIPVYSGVLAMENNAIPYEFGNSVSMQSYIQPIEGSSFGDLVYYELMHAGALPTAPTLANTIRNALESYGLGIMAEYSYMFATYILAAILSGGSLTTGTIIDALTSALSVLGIGLGSGGTVLVSIAAVIVAA